jgi:D-tyrosyl-tRNA(Tyr) deacylase
MRAVVQRVSRARVVVGEQTTGECENGLLVLVAAGQEDDEAGAAKLADRVAKLRIFSDEAGKMNRSLGDLPESEAPQVLVVSNFTLYGDAWKSRRPSFVKAAPYERGEELYKVFVASLREAGLRVAEGVYGGDMRVELLNEGPVTLWLDTTDR